MLNARVVVQKFSLNFRIMKKQMKTILRTICSAIAWLVICFGCGFIGWLVPRPQQSITEQLKSLQRQVGCIKIDAEIGPETTLLVNEAVKQERWELFNNFAAQWDYMYGVKK